MTNMRRISVSSNVGKVFEHIVNNRILKILPFTEVQADGRKGRSLTDHILYLKSMIRKSLYDKSPHYIAFLDKEKVYDKAWISAVSFMLWQNEIKGKIWRLIKNLTTNMTVQVKTRFGLTGIIRTRDIIKQGEVLSVTEYAKLVSNLNKMVWNCRRC